MTDRTLFQTARQVVALVTAASLLLPSVHAVQAAQSPTAKPTAAQTPSTKPAATQPSTAKPAAPAPRLTTANDAAIDGGWPRPCTTKAGARMLIYQPQIASWESQKKMVAYAAVSYQAKGAATPTLGTATIEADTNVSLETRLVKFTRLRVTESHFPTLDRDQTRDVVDTIVDGIPDTDRVIALDRVLASVEQSQIKSSNVDGVKADPPVIFYSTIPSILVNIDGDPIWSPIPQNDL